MNKQSMLAVSLLVVMLSSISIAQAQTLSKPNVNVPSGWNLDNETAYPNGPSEHDPAGGGMLAYLNPSNGDEVKIYYEKAQQSSATSADLKTEAVNLFERDLSDYTVDQSGTTQYAGVQAGFAKGYDSSVDAYLLDLVFLKSGYYINVIAYYDANSQSQSQVYSIINSISAGGGLSLGGSTLFIIIGVVAAVVVIVVVVVVMRKRKSPQQQLQQMPQPAPSAYPPPPPPPTQ